MTLIDTLIVLSIIALLIALTLPAVQSAREAARQTQCKNNLRNMGLASQLRENNYGHIPGPLLNAHPGHGRYFKDTGLFVSILPFIEHQNLFDSFDHSVTTFRSKNQTPLLDRPSFLKCPSTQESMKLSNSAEYFSGPASSTESSACDYAGNGGVFIGNQLKLGSVRLRVGELVRQQRLVNIRDGLSNTLLFWESRGDALFREDGSTGDSDTSGLTLFGYVLNESSNSVIWSTTKASYKSYVLSWAGFRIGSVQTTSQQMLSRSNITGQPLSPHSGLIGTVYLDGSVNFLSRDIDPDVLVSLATVHGGEVISFD